MCRCDFDKTICGVHADAVHKRLDRIEAIRLARGKDTVEVELILAELRIDYGQNAVAALAAARGINRGVNA